MAISLVGCGSREASQATKVGSVEVRSASYQDVTAQDYLATILGRYQGASSYHDNGQVLLSYRVGTRVEKKLAPLRVWLEPDELYIEAYDVRIRSDAITTTAWIRDEASGGFDSQVLYHPNKPEVDPASQNRQPSVGTALADPILKDFIAAGLAGPPPQLEWLFAAEPMKSLFEEGTRFTFEPDEAIGDRKCVVVRATIDRECYDFWIDEKRGLIRRVVLPDVEAAAEPGRTPQTMSLSIELPGARFETPEKRGLMDRPPANAKLVSRFVPLPPAGPPKVLGSRPKPFRLRDDQKDLLVTDQGSDRNLTLLVRFSGDPLSLDSLATAQQWYEVMPANLQSRLHVVAVVDERAQSNLPKKLRLPWALDQDGQASEALSLPPAGLVLLDHSGKIAWVQPTLLPPSLVSLGAIIADVLDGVDVPARMDEQWREQLSAYKRALKDVSVARSREGTFLE